MKKRKFEDVITNLRETIATPAYFSDFEKAVINVEEIEDGLNLLNGLIGAKEPEKKLESLIDSYGDVVTMVIPILHAVRIFKSKNNNNIRCLNTHTKELETIYFSGDLVDTKKIVNFCRESGLLEIFKTEKITSTKSYVTGVEVGLDSNARKNRTGTSMENIVENILKQTPNIEVYAQINTKKLDEIFNRDLSNIAFENKANKVFDFAFEYRGTLYLVETNFYSSQGSKLNETARSYKQLEVEINKKENCSFIWITDGIGWCSAKNNLKETYEHNKYVFTLDMLKVGITDLIGEENE